MAENGTTAAAPAAEKKNGETERTDICRDYLNKVCNRGTRCKFYHPPRDDEEPADTRSKKEEFSFCLDYQNQGCYRENCRFVHAPAQDVDNYKRTGDVSNVLARAIAAVTKKNDINGIPFCKEFQSGRCTRGQRCRYWHVNLEEERERRRRQMAAGGGAVDTTARPGYDQLRPQPIIPPRRRAADAPLDIYPPSKRGYASPGQMLGGGAPGYGAPDPYAAAQLERENADLRRENAELKRELQRERDRYDTLLGAINPAAAQQSLTSHHQQAQQQAHHHPDPYQQQQAPSQQPPQQQQPYGAYNPGGAPPPLHPVNAPVVQPVPPPQNQKWGQIKAPEWF